jgi:hypothetical protein
MMAQAHSEQRNCSTTPRTANGIIRRSDERRKSHRKGKVGIQTNLGACVHAATRISNKIAKINTPKPRSMTSLITSGFSKSSRRTNSPPHESGEVDKSHRMSSVQLSAPNLKRDGRSLPASLLRLTGRHALPLFGWRQRTRRVYRTEFHTVSE